MYQGYIRSVNAINIDKHHREELVPSDPSDLETVARYINNRINYEIRHSPEYPIITSANVHSKEYYTMFILSQATAYFTMHDYEKLDSKFSRLIKDYKAENSRLEYEVSQNRCKFEKEDNPNPGVVDQTKALILQLNHEIVRFRKRNNDKKADIAKHERINKKLHKRIDTHAEIILKHVTNLKDCEREFSQIQQTNNIEISRLSFANSKLKSEIRLLEQQLEAIDDRIELIMKRAGPNLFDEEPIPENDSYEI